MGKRKLIYPINEMDLHKKSYGKHTFEKIIIKGKYSTNSYAGVFYHYTSAEGLQGILKTRTLHFTDCQYLNDYQERVNINNDLSTFWYRHKQEYEKEFYKLLMDYRLEQYEDNQFSYMESDMISDWIDEPAKYFVLSASSNSDSLSLWKYYSKSGKYDGYCIGLNTFALTDEWIDRDTGVAIESGEVIYDSEEKQEIIQEAVNKLYQKWCTFKVSEKFNEKIKNDYISWVSITSLFFKEPCFADEEEYRFIAIAPISKLKSLKYDYDGFEHKMFDFRISNGLFVPYIKMPFYFWNEDCWAISSIGIAPSPDGEQKKLSLEQYVKYMDYKFPDLHIYNSKIPLRF